ncbi:uncharacterized protein BO95DRAFT_442232 [Aspergillus brunneoviolaceus CBS 621.78]|uniref:Uncharacterized protein n=1 Tax=Aspergillus brunneoviolaceus CBS 621.78 TaxID=1450534 RepID=A0ACD1GAT0_9EURO|nr:hypothetical protein BO95DRAFT_442232 [Aspergillus brunneoviolaceus CBS 621.78]RAH46358.1 hypothetical protein BO95DRAFT_442232 [Aspergillus brunneoviolaceus CBS 621.78]
MGELNPSDPSYQSSTTTTNSSSSTLTISTTLVTRCRTLLAELTALQSLLAQTQRNPQIVEVRSLRSSVLSELRMLEKLDAQVQEATAAAAAAAPEHDDAGAKHGDGDDEVRARLTHALRSSNLPFYEAVWAIAKGSCSGLVAFGKRFYWGGEVDNSGKGTGISHDGAGEQKQKKRSSKDKKKSVFVDIVAEDGDEWVKVSTISETRLLFEMAKKGWEADDSEDEAPRTVLRNHENGTGTDDEDEDDDDDDDDEIELVKLASDMRKAADVTRVRYRTPRLRFVIPKIEEGSSPEIDGLLKVIRGYGIDVTCGENVYSSQSETTQAEALERLLPKPFKHFTSTLNMDCTLLLAAVSDLSHYKDISTSPIHHKAINRQIEVEHSRPLLPTELWPAMVGRDLVCTEEAAQRMQEIVNIIGTETEKQRMRILMGHDSFAECTPEGLREAYQKLSDYEIPAEWRLPVVTVNAKPTIASAKDLARLPPVYEKVEQVLSDINHSVFLYGWAAGVMTISSNRTVVKQIESIVERNRGTDDSLEGPSIWVCDTARSLIGKEKGRKD